MTRGDRRRQRDRRRHGGRHQERSHRHELARRRRRAQNRFRDQLLRFGSGPAPKPRVTYYRDRDDVVKRRRLIRAWRRRMDRSGWPATTYATRHERRRVARERFRVAARRRRRAVEQSTDLMAKAKLTTRERKFVAEYLKHGNATQAMKVRRLYGHPSV